jgi:hypothetical protein
VDERRSDAEACQDVAHIGDEIEVAVPADAGKSDQSFEVLERTGHLRDLTHVKEAIRNLPY